MGLFGYRVLIAIGFCIACVSCFVPGLDGAEGRRGFESHVNYAVPRGGHVQAGQRRGGSGQQSLPRPAVTLFDFGVYRPAATPQGNDHISHGYSHGTISNDHGVRGGHDRGQLNHDHSAHGHSHDRLTQYNNGNGLAGGVLNIDHSTHDHSAHDHSAHGHNPSANRQDNKANGIQTAPINDHSTHDHSKHDHSAHSHNRGTQTQDYNSKRTVQSAPKHDHSAHDYSVHNHSAHGYSHDTQRHDHSTHDHSIHDYSKHDPSTHDHSMHDYSKHDPSTHDPSTNDHSTHDHSTHSQQNGMPGTRGNIIDFSLYPQSSRGGGSGGRPGGIRGQGRGIRRPGVQGRGNRRTTNPLSVARSRRLRGGHRQRVGGGNNIGISNNNARMGGRGSQVRGRRGQARRSQGRRSQGRRGGQGRGQGQVGYSENQSSSQMACPIGEPYPGRRCIGFMGGSCPYGYMCWRNPRSQVLFGYCCSMGFSPFQVF